MILVTGGTGFVGSAIVKEFRQRGEPVAVLGRDTEKIARCFGTDVEARTGDVREPAALAAAMRGGEIVINAVQFPGSPIENRRRGFTFEEIDLKGTRNQVDAAKAAGVKRFVYISGVGAAKDAAKHWFRYKWEAEDYLEKSGLQWVVLRPTWVFGPEDRSLNRFLSFASKLPFVPMFGNGTQDMQPVFIDDVARAAADCALKPEAANLVFEIGGPEVMSMNDVISAALEVQGKKRMLLHQPVFVGKTIGRLSSILPSPPLSADAIDFITSPAVADNRKLLEVMKPRLTPLHEGLRTYLAAPR